MLRMIDASFNHSSHDYLKYIAAFNILFFISYSYYDKQIITTIGMQMQYRYSNYFQNPKPRTIITISINIIKNDAPIIISDEYNKTY